MSLVRAFIAAELPGSLQDSIETATASLQAGLGLDLVRWVPTRNIHLTLKFLGDVSPSNLDLIKNVLAVEAARHEPFEMRVEGIGAFPNARRPRVLWIGLKGPPTLASLQHELDSATTRLGYESEERGYAPHLTIGRVRPTAGVSAQQRIGEELAHAHVGYLGMLHVVAVHLFKSDLGSTGPAYTKLLTAPFGTP
jgi:2'-5' RNA ligase